MHIFLLNNKLIVNINLLHNKINLAYMYKHVLFS